MWRRHVSAHPDGGQKPTEKSVIEFCYESVISFLRELIISIKVILFLIQWLFRYHDHPNISHFFNLNGRPVSRPPCKFCITEKLRNSSVMYQTKEESFQSKKFVWIYLVLAARVLHYERKNAGGAIILSFEFLKTSCENPDIYPLV